MKQSSILSYTLLVVSTALFCGSMTAQTSNITVFSPVYVRLAPGNTSGQPDKDSPPVNFNSSTLNLDCSVTPIRAVLTSSPSSGTNANLLVDNYINLTVTPGTTGTSAASPVDICGGGTSTSSDSGTDHSQECYSSGFSSVVGNLVGQNPDTIAATYGVPALDISAYLLPGTQQAQFDLVNLGDYLASSSIFLNTNCSQSGVSGQVSITGNTISTTNLTQAYTIDSTSKQNVQFVYDLSKSQQAGSLSINSGTVPYVTDNAVDLNTFQTDLVPNTSFATSSCLIHTGELFNGQPACPVYTLECTSGTSTTPSGAQCPVSSLPNEVFEEVFDGPGFTLPDIHTPNNGPVFHQGLGLLMASEGWTGGPCTFDSASGLQDLPCPQNLLTSFSGPGLFSLLSATSHPNSTFLAVTQVPEDLTTVTVAGQHPGNWVNTRTPIVTLSSQPPVLTGTTLPGASSFIASPIQSITYGISSSSALPSPSAPASTDTTVPSGVTCPLQANPSDPLAKVFAPPNQTIAVPADGEYLLHYFAQDCAGTKELRFTQNASTNSWSTSYYTYPINVDTVAPVVTSPGPILSPAADTLILGDYIVGQAVTATYSCTDELSGLVTCGASTYSPGSSIFSSGTLSSSVSTSKTGPQTYTVEAIDAAGNQSSKSVSYNVIAYDYGIQITQAGKKVDVSVSPISGHPATGSVELYIDISPYQSAKLTGGGVAHFSTNELQGTHKVSAVYSGNLSPPVTLTFK